MDITVATLETDYATLPEAITIVISSDYSGPPGSGGGGTGGHTVQDEGVDLTARTNLNFVGSGVTVTDDSGNDATLVTISGGSTDLTYTASTRVVASSTGTDATLTLADGTNPGLMTSADFTKLSGVESGATADQSAAELLTAIKTVDGTGTGLDADLLDGLEAASILESSGGNTGVFTGGILSIGTPNTTFSISDGYGYVLDDQVSPTALTKVQWSGKSNISVTNIGSQLITFVCIESDGTVVQQAARWTPDQFRTCIIIGVVVHVDLATVNAVNQEQHLSFHGGSDLADLYEVIGFVNAGGNEFSGNPDVGLNLQKSAGTLFGHGVNYANDRETPNHLTLGPTGTGTGNQSDFQYRLSDGTYGTGGDAAYASLTNSLVHPGRRETFGASPAALTDVTTNRFTIQRIYIFASGAIKLQYGTTEYLTIASARSSIATESFTTEPSIATNGLLVAYLIVKSNCTDLTDPATAVFVQAAKFGTGSGAGGGMTGAEILAALVLVDGTGTGLDADLLDGQEAAAFAAASHTHAATAVTIADAGGYYTGTDVEAALQEAGSDLAALGDVTALQKLFAGVSLPASALRRWKAGPGLEATTLTAAISDSATTIALFDASFRADTVNRLAWIDDEEIWITAELAGRTVTDGVLNTTTTVTSATASFAAATDTGRRIEGTGIPHGAYISSVTNSTTVVLSAAATATASGVTLTLLEAFTVARGVNGTTAASHSAGAAVKATKVRRVLHLGDSIAEGTTGDTAEAGDGWSVRAGRIIAKLLGGEIGQMWPMWRRTSVAQVHQEWALTGSATTNPEWAQNVGWGGGVIFTPGTGNGAVWTRPPWLNVSMIDIHWLDYASNSCNWSYSVDGGSTWVDNPLGTTIYSTGTALMRRTRVLVDNPTTVRIRAANAAGTSKGFSLPFVPLTTWSSPPVAGVTEGVLWGNLGSAGARLRSFLNSRTYTDLQVTNGDATVTSATINFTTADVGVPIMLEGVEYTILSRTSATEIELTTTYTGTTSTADARGTVFRGCDADGDPFGTLLGHRGSTYPDLIIMGPWDNDEAALADGDGNADAMYDMLTFFHSRVGAVADILYIAPHESDDISVSIATQTAYRTAIELVASENGAACLNLYDAFAAYGLTGFDQVDAAGYMEDAVHFSQTGEKFIAEHLRRILEIV